VEADVTFTTISLTGNNIKDIAEACIPIYTLNICIPIYTLNICRSFKEFDITNALLFFYDKTYR